MQAAVGMRLGPYELVARIGAGGMGEVWKARDTRLNRPIALKIIRGGYANDEKLRQRLEREAKAISQLNHPNICTLFDVGHQDGTDYLVMELCEGEMLSDRIRRGAMPVSDVVRYGSEIADALDQAHKRSIVHRDLKPTNIILTRAGAKLLDFGLAQTMVPHHRDSATVEIDAKLTTEGTVVGTLPYMAPEQLSGETADHRADIWALGAVIFEMLTGRRAFDGDGRMAIVTRIVREASPRLSQFLPDAPPALEHIVDKCLEKDSDDRWQSAHDIAEELRWSSSASSGASMATVVVPVPKRWTWREWSGAAAVCLVMSAIAFFAGRSDRVQTPGYVFTNPYSADGYDAAELAVISPDGRSVVFIAITHDRRRMLFVRRLDTPSATPLAGTEGALGPEWSYDGKTIFYWAAGKYMRIPARGGAPQPVVAATDEYGVTSNAAGVVLAGVGESGIVRVDSGGTKVITTFDSKHGEHAHAFPTFLPDGRHFLFTAQVQGARQLRLYAGSLDSNEVKHLGDVSSRVRYVEPGYLLTVRDGWLVAIPFDADTLRMRAEEAVSLVQAVRFFPATGPADFSVSAEGTLTTRAADDRFALHWVSAGGAVSAPLDAPTVYALPAVCRLDRKGRTVLVMTVDPKRGTRDLWLTDIQRGTKIPLTKGAGEELIGALSPDAGRLYYSSMRNGWPDIFEMRLDGSGPERLVAGGADGQFPCDVSPDGKSLLYMTYENEENGADLYAVRLDEAALKPRAFVATAANEGETEAAARFSPDGQWVAYLSDVSGTLQAYVKRYPSGGAEVQISNGQQSVGRLSWSGDGRRIHFLRRHTLVAVSFDPSTGAAGPEQPLFDVPYDVAGYDAAPDGRFLMMLASKTNGGAATRIDTQTLRTLKR